MPSTRPESSGSARRAAATASAKISDQHRVDVEMSKTRAERLAKREVGAKDRDRIADQRERIADERERIADEREEIADRRELLVS